MDLVYFRPQTNCQSFSHRVGAAHVGPASHYHHPHTRRTTQSKSGTRTEHSLTHASEQKSNKSASGKQERQQHSTLSSRPFDRPRSSVTNFPFTQAERSDPTEHLTVHAQSPPPTHSHTGRIPTLPKDALLGGLSAGSGAVRARLGLASRTEHQLPGPRADGIRDGVQPVREAAAACRVSIRLSFRCGEQQQRLLRPWMKQKRG